MLVASRHLIPVSIEALSSPAPPRTIGAVLDQGIYLWLRTLRATLPLCVPFVFASLMPYFVLWLQSGRLTLVPSRGTAAEHTYLATSLLQLLLRWAMTSAMYVWYCARETRQPTSLAAAAARGFKLLPRQILATLALGAIVVAVMLLVGLVFTLDRGLAIFIVCAALFVALVLFARLMLLTVLMAVENRRAIESMNVSFSLTRGHALRTLAVGSVVFILYLAVCAIVSVVADFLFWVLGLTIPQTDAEVGFVATIVSPWVDSGMAAVLYCLYLDLKKRKQGQDLEVRIEQLVAETA